MKKNSLLIAALSISTIFTACDKGKDACNIELSNPSDAKLSDVQVVIKRDSLVAMIGELPEGKTLCVEEPVGNCIPSQLDDLDGDGKWDELAFVYNMQPQQTLTLKLVIVSNNDLPKFKNRTQAHFGKKIGNEPVKAIVREVLTKSPLPRGAGYPYKTDGPTWENDMVGYRHYFDGRNCRDFFCKRTSEMVLDTVGIWPDGTIGDTYHTLKSWGRDVLGVGQSFGLGGLAVLSGDSLVRLGVLRSDSIDNSDSTVFTLVSSGPVRSIIKLDNYGWNLGNTKLNVHQTITIWAGRYVYENDVKLEGDSTAKFLITGLVHNNDSNGLKINKYTPGYTVLYTHDKQTYNRQYYMGLAVLVPTSELINTFDTPAQGSGILYTYCAKLKAPFAKPLKYYAMAACEIKDQKFIDSTEFLKVLNNEATILNNPLKIQLKALK